MTADELKIKFLRCYIAELAGFAPTIGHVIESNNVDSAAAAKKLKTLYAEADELTQKKVEQTFKSAVAAMKVKVTKDLAIMSEIDHPDDYILPMTNRSNVSLVL